MSTLHLHRGRAVNPMPSSEADAPRKSPSILKRLTPQGAFRKNKKDERIPAIDSLARSLAREEIVSPPSINDHDCKNGSFRLLLASRRRTNSVNTVMSDESFHNNIKNSVDTPPTSITNVMQWLEYQCPEDILPNILAYAGPQITSTLSKTNKHWNFVVKKEGTWKVMCEELYKVCFVLFAFLLCVFSNCSLNQNHFLLSLIATN